MLLYTPLTPLLVVVHIGVDLPAMTLILTRMWQLPTAPDDIRNAGLRPPKSILSMGSMNEGSPLLMGADGAGLGPAAGPLALVGGAALLGVGPTTLPPLAIGVCAFLLTLLPPVWPPVTVTVSTTTIDVTSI